MKYSYLVFFLTFLSICRAQTYSGEIFIKDQSALVMNQVYVTNLTTHQSVLSEYTGRFSIPAKTGDHIRFTSIVTDRKDVTVTEQMINKPFNVILLSIAYEDIQEVVINKFKPTGILKADLAKIKITDKTSEIRKMIGLPQPVGDGLPPTMPIASLANGGLNLSIDAIFDVFTGNKIRKERLANYEKMMTTVKEIRNYFGDAYFTKLNIPKNLIDNFIQFVYTSDNIYTYVESGNYEATVNSIEKYLPVYKRRLANSNLQSTIN